MLLRGVGPHSHPQTESSGVVWGGTLPTCAARRVGCPRSRGLSRHWSTEGLVDARSRGVPRALARGACERVAGELLMHRTDEGLVEPGLVV